MPEVMFKAGIRTQKDLIERIKKFDPTIKVRPITISGLYNNKTIHLPVDLIYGICAVTDSKPGDWIQVELDDDQLNN